MSTLESFVRERYWPVARVNLCPAWQRRTEDLIRLICDELGKQEMTCITTEQVEVWWAGMREKFATPVTPNKALIRLKHVFKTAVRWKAMMENPAQDIHRVREPEREFTILTDEQHTALLAKANPRLKLYILVARYTGARRSSIVNLEERDVNLVGGTITFRRTKNGEDHTLPLHPALRNALEPRLTGDPSRRLLPQYKSPQAVSRAMNRLARRVGVLYRFHDYRHDLGTRLGAAGYNVRVIMDTLGHKDSSMSIRYTHTSRAVLKNALADVLPMK